MASKFFLIFSRFFSLLLFGYLLIYLHVSPSHPDLDCGDTICVYGHGTHTVVDTGGGVAEGELDHYTGVSGCNVCTAPGDDIMTIKLF